MSTVTEFMPTNIQEPLPFKYFYFFCCAILVSSKIRARLNELILIVLFSYMSFYSVRYAALFAIMMVPIVLSRIEFSYTKSENKIIKKIRTIDWNISKAEKNNKGFIWIILALIIVFVLGKFQMLEFKFDDEIKPVAAVNFLLKEKIKGNMFNNDEFGDYLIYAAHPEYKVFFDGRSDMYGEDHLKKYFKVTGIKNNWEKVIEEYDIKWIFYDADSLLSRYLSEKKDWRLIYADKVAHIYVKNLPEYRHLMKKHIDVVPIIY